MPRISKEKITEIKKLYELGEFSDAEVAVKAQVDKRTVVNFAKKEKWIKSPKIPKEIEKDASVILKAVESKDATVLATAGKLLPFVTELIELTLERYKEKMDNDATFIPPIRELTALLTKLMEAKAKLSGELEDTGNSDKRRQENIERFTNFMDILEQKNITNLTGNPAIRSVQGEIIDTEAFVASVVEKELG